MSKLHLVPGWVWWRRDDRIGFGMQPMRRADAESFVPLSAFWGRDKDCVYCAGSEVRGADLGTFRVLNDVYAVDARRAYTITGPIKDADAATFRAIGPTEHFHNTTNGYSADGRSVFHTTVGGKACVLKGADPATFAACGRGFGRDARAVYFERSKLPGADPAEWRHLRGPHSASGKKAYCLARRIAGADGSTLESLPMLVSGDRWSRDRDGTFLDASPKDLLPYQGFWRDHFIFVGRVTSVVLRSGRGADEVLLAPELAESWSRADHAWIDVSCREWVQRAATPASAMLAGPVIRFGEGLRLKLLEARTWMNEERIWMFRASVSHDRAEPRLHVALIDQWIDYLGVDRLEAIRELCAAAAKAC